MFMFFFFKQKTAYEMRISDWSSDVCSSDLLPTAPARWRAGRRSSRPPSRDHHIETGPDHRDRRTLMTGTNATRGGAGASGVPIGRASCRERVCPYVEISVVAGSLKKKKRNHSALKQSSMYTKPNILT